MNHCLLLWVTQPGKFSCSPTLKFRRTSVPPDQIRTSIRTAAFLRCLISSSLLFKASIYRFSASPQFVLRCSSVSLSRLLSSIVNLSIPLSAIGEHLKAAVNLDLVIYPICAHRYPSACYQAIFRTIQIDQVTQRLS